MVLSKYSAFFHCYLISPTLSSRGIAQTRDSSTSSDPGVQWRARAYSATCCCTVTAGPPAAAAAASCCWGVVATTLPGAASSASLKSSSVAVSPLRAPPPPPPLDGGPGCLKKPPRRRRHDDGNASGRDIMRAALVPCTTPHDDSVSSPATSPTSNAIRIIVFVRGRRSASFVTRRDSAP